MGSEEEELGRTWSEEDPTTWLVQEMKQRRKETNPAEMPQHLATGLIVASLLAVEPVTLFMHLVFEPDV